VIASGLSRGSSVTLGLCVCGAMVMGASAAKTCKPQWIHGVIYVALFLMLYPPMLDVDFPPQFVKS
jgi:ACR3 family arsenite efflux pump ArsB